jgi:hypothetical protein
MILSSHGLIASQIASFDADAVAFFGRVTTAGGTLSTTEKQAVNTLVVDMKAYGIWSAMKAIYPMVGASAAACAQNLKSSSYPISFSSGWTFNANGIKPNGSSAFGTLGFSPSTFSSTETMASIYFRTMAGSGVAIGGGSSYFYLPSRILNNYPNNNGTADQSLANGFYSFGAKTGTNSKLYRNGTNLATGNTTYFDETSSLTLANYSGGFWQQDNYAFVSSSLFLDATQASNFYTAVQAFQTTLSRAVAP